MPLDFTAIDFETANSQRSSACAIGMAKVRDGQIVDRFQQLICPPEGPDCFTNTWVHGIGPDHVRAAPGWGELLPEVRAFAGRDVLVAHNAPFDRSVFVRSSEAWGQSVTLEMLCTLKLARRLLTLASYRLPDVTQALGLSAFAHHDAGADADAAALVAVRLAEHAGVDDVAGLSALAPAPTRSSSARASSARTRARAARW